MEDDGIIKTSASGFAVPDEPPTHGITAISSPGGPISAGDDFNEFSFDNISTGNTPERSTTPGFSFDDYILDGDALSRPLGDEGNNAARNDSLTTGGHALGGNTRSTPRDKQSSAKTTDGGGTSHGDRSGSTVPKDVIERAVMLALESKRTQAVSSPISHGSTMDHGAFNRFVELTTCEKLKAQIIGESH